MELAEVVGHLAVLRRFPVRGLGGDPAALRMIRMVVNLAHDLGLAVVAEGVEELAQLVALRELGCGCAQGYLLGRALDPDAAMARLRLEAECLSSGVLALTD